MGFFVQVVIWGNSDETVKKKHLKCKIGMSSVNLGMFYHYPPIWSPVQKIPLGAMHYGMDLISSLVVHVYIYKLLWNIGHLKMLFSCLHKNVCLFFWRIQISSPILNFTGNSNKPHFLLKVKTIFENDRNEKDIFCGGGGCYLSFNEYF